MPDTPSPLPPPTLPDLSHRPLLLWGTGRVGETTLAQVASRYTVAGAIHGGPGEMKSWHGLPVSSPDAALTDRAPRPFVIVATMYLEEVGAELERRGYRRGADWCHADEAVAGMHDATLAEPIARWTGRLSRPEPVTTADLSGFDDEFWLWLNLQGADARIGGGLVAPLPSAAIQQRLTGTSGNASIAHGFNQYRLMKQLLGGAGVDLGRARCILDFGCGYARIVRFFRKDAPQAEIVGVDVDEMLVDWCRTHLAFGDWQLVPPLPPTTLPTGACSLVVSFSVFTHLSEASQLAWLEEIHRWLEPGGVAVVTLWTHPSTSRDYHLPHFPDFDALVTEFEAGRFCFSNRCYSEGSTYGEAFVPRGWVERMWTRWFDVVGWLERHPWSPSQTHVALRRR